MKKSIRNLVIGVVMAATVIAASSAAFAGQFVQTDMNFRSRFGEIDIVARDGEFVVFVEVKYRKTSLAGHPEEAVDIRKARTISKVADYYRVVRKLPYDTAVRFDVVAIEGDTFRWYKNAFSYIS